MGTQKEFSKMIRDALSVSDPTLSTSLGTVQRNIIEAVASELSSLSTEQTATYFTGFLESYSGTDLDTYVNQFGFARQAAEYATGYITIKRYDAADSLEIPYGATFYKPSDSSNAAVYFTATSYTRLDAGVATSGEIPVVASVAGTSGNVAAGTVTYSDEFSDYVTITNPVAMTGGSAEETDGALRSRFKNTLYRNMAGTKDQYIALALCYAYCSRARLIGSVSEWSEVVSVFLDGGTLKATQTCPDFENLIDTDRVWFKQTDTDDYLNQGVAYTVSSDTATTYSFNTGLASEAGITVGPFDDDGYAYLADNNVSAGSLVLYIIGTVDINLNKSCYLLEELSDGSRVTMRDWVMYEVPVGQTLTTGTVYAIDDDYIFHPTSDIAAGTKVWVVPSLGVFCGTSIVANEHAVIDTSGATAIDLDSTHSSSSVSLFGVEYTYSPVAEGQFLVLSTQYKSTENRSGSRNIDLYVDGDNLTSVENVCFINSSNAITEGNRLVWQRDNGVAPTVGNRFVRLSYLPACTVNDTISVGAGIVLNEGTDYWLCHDVGEDKGSIRSDDIVEFNVSSPAVASLAQNCPVHIGFLYNAVPSAIQSLVDANTPVGTDALVHEAVRRYVVIYLTVMYSVFPKDDVNTRIEDALTAWVNSLDMGSEVQLSDIETVVANLAGVDNVRITTAADANNVANSYGIVEYYRDGKTVKAQHTSDFSLKQDEILVFNDVVIKAKTQQGW